MNNLSVVPGSRPSWLNDNGDALLPEGIYPFSYVKHSPAPWRLHQRWRISVTVAVVGGAYAGAELDIYYSVTKPPKGSDHEFDIPKGKSSHLRRDVIGIFREPTTQIARLSDYELEAVVTTVMKDSEKTALPDNLHYSRAKYLRLR